MTDTDVQQHLDTALAALANATAALAALADQAPLPNPCVLFWVDQQIDHPDPDPDHDDDGPNNMSLPCRDVNGRQISLYLSPDDLDSLRTQLALPASTD